PPPHGVTTGPRTGAIHATHPAPAAMHPYTELATAAKADASSDIQSQLTVTSQTGTDSSGNYAQVTVIYPFTTITNYPGIPSSVTITRTCTVRVAPAAPN